MGLDWIGFNQMDGEWEQTGYYRGKGIAYDKNIEEIGDLDNDCYGIEDHDHTDICGCSYMPRNIKWYLYAEIVHLLEKPSEEILLNPDYPNETYEVWREFMVGAKEFLETNDRVFCWY